MLRNAILWVGCTPDLYIFCSVGGLAYWTNNQFCIYLYTREIFLSAESLTGQNIDTFYYNSSVVFADICRINQRKRRILIIQGMTI